MIHGLPPVSRKDAHTLILGSMPGEKSIRAQEYYAHPQNAFWKIMGKLYGEAKSYRQKTALLKKNKLALWDVIGTCRRKGSLDTAIKQARYNDLEGFLKKHPRIKRVFLNGGMAHSSYLRYAKGKLTIPHTRLPSTSPANTVGFERKLKVWRKALNLPR